MKMKTNENASIKPARLRRQTENLLLQGSPAINRMSASHIRNLLEDLQVYVVELENENEELRRIKEEFLLTSDHHETRRDAPGQNQTAAALKESEDRYRTLFHDSLEAHSVSIHGKIVEVNSKWLKLHGFDDASEVIGKDVLQFIFEEDRRILKERRNRWPRKMESVYELRDVRRDGSIVDVEVYSSRIKLEGKEAILATIHDITDRKRLVMQDQQMRKMEALNTLLGGIAHQFNNALSAITAHAGLLEMEFGESDKVMECVRPMKKAAWRMAGLISRFLAYERGGAYNPEAISINQFIQSNMPSFLGSKGSAINVNMDFEPNLPKVLADRKGMKTVLSAAAENAFDAVEKEGGCITVKTETKLLKDPVYAEAIALKPGQYVCFSLADNGKGMDTNTKARVFDPFFTTHFIGRGLGMSVAYGIVKHHGGSITIDSEPEKGTTVCVYLPAAA